ncbi:Cir/Yir/Bir family protein [Bradyrhizobium sp. JYMT SZCCT0180]|nr:Cir/Yir/Bir family protein [Bradyrhizobium sp. JYMT SZCCT0180]
MTEIAIRVAGASVWTVAIAVSIFFAILFFLGAG